MIDVADFIKLQNEKHQESIAQCRQLGLEQPDFNDCWTELMVLWYEDFILKAKEQYYLTSEPMMDDMAYDKLEDYLRAIKPESEALKKVGA